MGLSRPPVHPCGAQVEKSSKQKALQPAGVPEVYMEFISLQVLPA
jgi:hypothetical protein